VPRRPRRSANREGQAFGEDIAKLAGASATRGAKPLNYNQFKIRSGQSGDARVRDARAESCNCSATRPIYGGSDVVIGASWDLLPWFVAAGAAFIIVHAVLKALAGWRGDVH
jgi:hypothetical protein